MARADDDISVAAASGARDLTCYFGLTPEKKRERYAS